MCLRTSRKLMGCMELWVVEFSNGPQKDRPLSFQSDCSRSVWRLEITGKRMTCLSVDEDGIWRKVAMDKTGIVMEKL